MSFVAFPVESRYLCTDRIDAWMRDPRGENVRRLPVFPWSTPTIVLGQAANKYRRSVEPDLKAGVIRLSSTRRVDHEISTNCSVVNLLDWRVMRSGSSRQVRRSPAPYSMGAQ